MALPTVRPLSAFTMEHGILQVRLAVDLRALAILAGLALLLAFVLVLTFLGARFYDGTAQPYFVT